MSEQQMRQRLVILGSTGSIGTTTLDLVRRYPEKFEVLALVAHRNRDGLRQQIEEFKPRYAVLVSDDGTFKQEAHTPHTEVLPASELLSLAAHPDMDTVVAAIVGFAGLPPTYAALKAGKRVLLANKESIVCGGELLIETARRHHATLIPIDSEHSALFQLLGGQAEKEVSKLVLTASGGPFLLKDKSEFSSITPEQAVKHPRWTMGMKISIDSASLVNKALELIEARWLFDRDESEIDVLIHPESIIHSMIAFKDGTLFAQLSVTDMAGPIAYGLGYPEGRLRDAMRPLDLVALGSLTFHALDEDKFPAVSLARAALREGGAMPAVFNIANEIAVARFVERKLKFSEITFCIERALEHFSGRRYSTAEDLLELECEMMAWAFTPGHCE